MRLDELQPGDQVHQAGMVGILIGVINPHPLWRNNLCLAIWYMPLEERFSFDALLPYQEVGELVHGDRIARLNHALFEGQQ